MTEYALTAADFTPIFPPQVSIPCFGKGPNQVFAIAALSVDAAEMPKPAFDVCPVQEMPNVVGLTVRAKPMPSPVFGKGPVQVLVAASFDNSAPKLGIFKVHQFYELAAASLTVAAPTLDSGWLQRGALFPMLHHDRLLRAGSMLKKRRVGEAAV